MGKSSVPFKTNVNRPIRKSDEDALARLAKARKANEGYWVRPQDRPMKVRLVDDKKERKELSKWVVIWVVVVPLGFMAMLWLILLFADMFTF